MAVYKVPQDVEADDKLLGPFSFRQFLYLIAAVMGVVLAWGLSRLLVPLAIIPLPIVIFFGALALPLRKDQPMEIYLAAVISFYLKPRKRLWKADGVQSLIEIVVPKTVDERRTKEFDDAEAEKRLSYLASLVDSRGWAVRGVEMPQVENAMQDDVFFEAQQAEDVLDTTSSLTNSFNTMIDKAEAKRRQNAINLMSRPAVATPTPDPIQAPVPTPSQAQAQPDPAVPVVYNPYPGSMRQTVIQPRSTQPQPTPEPIVVAAQPTQAPTPETTSNEPVSAGIMNLANNSDLSIETLAHEAKRIREKEESSDGEVVISLR
jgi:hypothetical protein